MGILKMNTLKTIVSVIITALGIIILSCSQQNSLPAEFSTDGTLIVLNKSDDTAMLISLMTGEIIATIPTGPGPHEGAVSPDGQTLIVSEYGTKNPSTLIVIDLINQNVINKIELGSNLAPNGIVFFPDGERVIVTAEQSRTVTIVNIRNGTIEQSISTGDNACHMVLIYHRMEAKYG
jgi:DNA-binding beta-propeller fold protein YncE